ncbi:MAG: hypothetical protein IIA45_13145 [Bacteroidetes bacterium]|nr:hypothetical protein [Bacteroidota bacterium]
MSLLTNVKAGAITNLTEARFYSAAGVEWIGLCVDGSPGCLDAENSKSIVKWLAGSNIIAEFRNLPLDDINSFSSEIEWDGVQVSFDHEALDKIMDQYDLVIAEIKISELQELQRILDSLSERDLLYLLDFNSGNIKWDALKTDKSVLASLKNAANHYRLLIDIKCTKDNVLEIMETVEPHGLQIRGSGEDQTGVKLFDEAGEILDVLSAES